MWQDLIRVQTLTFIALLCCVLSYTSMFSLQLPLQSQCFKNRIFIWRFCWMFLLGNSFVAFLLTLSSCTLHPLHFWSHMQNSFWCKCLWRWNPHVSGKSYNHPNCSFHRASISHSCCKLSLPILAANYHFTGWDAALSEAASSADCSCACTVEYSDCCSFIMIAIPICVLLWRKD